MIVDSIRPITLVGGADIRPGDLTVALRHAPGLVAADSGADSILAAGLRPEAVIGDMDSLSGRARAEFADMLHPVPEQDSTDFDKALRHIAAPLVVAVGFSGGRLDHELAALHGLIVNRHQPCIVLGDETLTFLCPPQVSLTLNKGSVVSLFPMGQVQVASTGLRWPTAGIDFAPDQRIGTSNAASGGAVTLWADAPLMLVILLRSALPGIVTSLCAPQVSRWPPVPLAERPRSGVRGP